MAKQRSLGDKRPNVKKSSGPKNAPAPQIPRAKINKHTGLADKQKKYPEMYPQQLNPISSKFGQPQYKDETPLTGKHLRAILAHLKNS